MIEYIELTIEFFKLLIVTYVLSTLVTSLDSLIPDKKLYQLIIKLFTNCKTCSSYWLSFIIGISIGNSFYESLFASSLIYLVIHIFDSRVKIKTNL